MVLKRPLHVVSLVLLFTAAGSVIADKLGTQRATFLKAEQALERGELAEFDRLRTTLRDYPLFPYLEFASLDGRLRHAKTSEVAGFLETYASTPLANLLRARWLNRLADDRRWTDYIRFYQGSDSVTRQCHYLHALIATGKSAEAMPQVAEIWLHGRSRPDACDPVFSAWTKAGQRGTDMIWGRIERAFEAGELRLAEFLARSLPDSDRAWVARWAGLFRDPKQAGERSRFVAPHPYREVMLSHAVRRLARRDGMQAMRLWKDIKPKYPFSEAQVQRTEHYIVRNLARAPEDEAYAFVRGVAVGDDALPVHEARIQAALLREDWAQVVRWIAAIPARERNDERWNYWLARALEGNGDGQAAKALYEKVARERSYYGFMAADRIGIAYHLDHVETPASDERVGQIARLDAVRRAQELFALQRWTDARREWRAATAGLDAEQLKAAAKLAKQRGWHDRAIFTLAQTGYWDDLELRFPLEHAKLVEENAKRHDIENAWIFAVMRQESAFMSNAQSHAGAMGLMQLMPATARSVARKMLKRTPPRRGELFEPDTNIALGSAYLKQMKEQLGDSAVLATAAYNAGPHRVTRWLPERTLPADIWIELVPFEETRGYLRRVLAYTVIYEKRMGRQPTRLNERLHPVPPSLNLLGRIQTAQTGSPS